MEGRLCAFLDCEKEVFCKEWCQGHYQQQWQGKELKPLMERRLGPKGPCEFETCERISVTRGLCATHYNQLRAGKQLSEIKPRSTGWSDVYGYRYIRMPEHPNAHTNGRVAEHTVVMSEMLGRPLLPGENVHHKNGVRDDNRPENLELWSKVQPAGQRVADKVDWAREILALYGDLV